LSDAVLLRTQFYTYGIAANCFLKVYKRNKITNVTQLKYTAKFDFTTVSDTVDGFEITAVSDDVSKKLMTNDAVKYDIDISTQKATKILRFNGISAVFEESVQTSSQYDNNVNIVNYGKMRIEMDDYKHINVQGVIAYRFRPADGYNIVAQSPCKVNLNTVGSTRRFIYSNIVSNGSINTINVYERVYKYDASTGTESVVATLSTTPYPITSTTPPDLDVNLPYLNADLTVGEIDLDTNDMLGIFIEIDSTTYNTSGNLRYICDVGSITQTLSIDAPLPQANFGVCSLPFIFNQLCLKTCGASYKSDLLDSLNIFLVTPRTTFTYYVDGVQQVWDIMTTSMQEFYEYMNSLLPVGIGVELIGGVEYVRLESLQYWLDQSQPSIYFDNIDNVTIEVVQDLIPNTIVCGFNDYTYSEQFGLQEFMGQHQFKTPQEFLKNELRIVSPYRMDNTGFDYIRKLNIDMWFKGAINGLSVQNVVGEVAEWNDIFAFDCAFVETISGVDYYELNRNDISVTDVNFLKPTFAYNLYYTPYRNFLRHGNYIASVLRFFEAQQILHTTTSKYPYLSTQEITEADISEGSNPLVSAIGTPYFMPFIVTFTAPFTDALNDLYEANNLSLIEIEYRGATLTGYLMSADKKLAGLKETEFKILLTNLNTLTNLY